MKCRRPFLAAALAVLAATPPVAVADFARDIFPLFRRACFECHGAEKQKGGLRLDTREHFLKGGRDGAVFVAGQPDQSDLVRRISLPKGHKEAMPNRGEPLRSAEIAAIRAWIAEGARWPEQVTALKHWAYIPPRKPALPAVKNPSWPKNDIDRFILARLEAGGLQPSSEADPAVLVRRLSLDLTGLPPPLEMVQRFVAAYPRQPQQYYEALVDELLASEEFGVKWARHWLDLARYADSHGFQRDDLREVWAYRDWVVKAMNAGMPFDQFTLEQVAGDLLPNATQDQIIATGFHRCTPTNVEAGTEPEESRINQVIDRVNTTGAVWLGATLECCQCHNHKYDPFTQQDFYGLLAYFNNTEAEADRSNPKAPGSIRFLGPSMPLGDPQKDQERQQLESLIADLKIQIKERRREMANTKPNIAKTPAPESATETQTKALKFAAFEAESGAEHELQSDGSVLLKGDAPPVDTYSLETEIEGTGITGIRLDALTDPSLPGEGPGRGDAGRPNFVLHSFEVSLLPPGSKDNPQRLAFAGAFASFSQANFDAAGAVDDDPKTAWAINPQFHQPHWAVFRLDKPLDAPPGSRLQICMAQNFGGGRTIGRFKISAITGDIADALPATLNDEKPVAAAKNGRKKNSPAAARSAATDPQLRKLELQQLAAQKKLDALQAETTLVMKELLQPRMTTVFKRGEYTTPGEKVSAGTPAIIDLKASGPPNRIALAEWLVSRDNPLTARVTVNRWWAEIFGQGIVSTVEDFGIKGEPPTHPELLDSLAVDFMDSGWSMKSTIKKIVMSAAYRQSSNSEWGMRNAEPAAAIPQSEFRNPHSIDSTNTLLWRGPRFRLDAEAIRDNALSIAGLLSLQKGGPSIRPPQPDGLWKKVGGQDYKYEVSPGEAQYRRGIYVVLKRGSPYPSFMNFDASQRMACVVKRSRSNTPLQALTLLNDPVYVEATKAFAKRISESPEKTTAEKINRGFRIALARSPTSTETAMLKRLFDDQIKSSKKTDAAWYSVASAILNLDECITKG